MTSKYDITDFNQPGINYTGRKSGGLNQLRVADQLWRNPVKRRQLRTSYWNKYIIKKYDKNNNVYLYDNRLKKKINKSDVNDIVFQWRSGSATPKEDLNYLEKKDELRILKDADKDKLGGVRQILSDVRAGVSSDVTGPEGTISKEYDLNRKNKIKTLEKELTTLKVDSSYASDKEQSQNPYIDSWLKKQQQKLQIVVPKNKEIQTTSGQNLHHDLTPSNLVKEQNKKLSPLTIQQ